MGPFEVRILSCRGGDDERGVDSFLHGQELGTACIKARSSVVLSTNYDRYKLPEISEP